MQGLKNKDGSVILWAIIFTNILVILLGSLLTLSYGYHKSTIETVKKQQAYFTARSATDAILSDISSKGNQSELMPTLENQKINISDINFDDQKIGSASAVIKKQSENTIDIQVSATYANNTYKMKATMKSQAVMFGGVAMRNLVTNGNTFNLKGKTDLYYDPDTSPNVNAQPDINAKLIIGGNLVSKGNITLKPGSKIGDKKFINGLKLDNDNSTNAPKKKIWSKDSFVISNYELDAKYPIRDEESLALIIKAKLKLNYNTVRPNNVFEFYEGKDNSNVQNPDNNPKHEIFGFEDKKLGNLEMSDFSLDNDVRYIKISNRNKDGSLKADDKRWTGAHMVYPNNHSVSPVHKGYEYQKIYFSNDNRHRWAWKKKDKNYAARLHHIYTLDFLPNGKWSRYVKKDPSNYNDFWHRKKPGINRYFSKDCFDSKQIDYSSSGWFNKNDTVSSVAYLLVDDECKLRLKYGLDGSNGIIIDSIEDFFDKLKKEQMTYLICYLGKDSVLELGARAKKHYNDAGQIIDTKNNPDLDDNRLKFYMSVYGEEGSKLILNKNVKLFGSINVHNLIINGSGVEATYMAQNGGEVAKQEVDNLWTVSNYTDK